VTAREWKTVVEKERCGSGNEGFSRTKKRTAEEKHRSRESEMEFWR